MASAISRASGLGLGELSMNKASQSGRARAAASASACAAARPAAPLRATLARPSVNITMVGVSPRRRACLASAATLASAAARGVPPPPGRPARQRLARTSERVGGNTSSAEEFRNATTATVSRRM
jgi:hypothetical protein